VIGIASFIFPFFVCRIGLFPRFVQQSGKGEAAECVVWRKEASVLKHSCAEEDLVDLLPVVVVEVAADSLVSVPAIVKKCSAVCLDFCGIKGRTKNLFY